MPSRTRLEAGRVAAYERLGAALFRDLLDHHGDGPALAVGLGNRVIALHPHPFDARLLRRLADDFVVEQRLPGFEHAPENGFHGVGQIRHHLPYRATDVGVDRLAVHNPPDDG